jgi:hypothetical protein
MQNHQPMVVLFRTEHLQFGRVVVLRINQSMKPAAPSRSNPNVIATRPCRGLSLSR